MIMTKATIPTEAQEQKVLFSWIEYNRRRYPELEMCYHIPNGGSRDVREAHNLKTQGVKPGVPDICLPVAKGGYHGLYIELKRKKGGQVSAFQKTWIQNLSKNGYLAVVAKGADEAIQILTRYLSESLRA